ncbi:hypothetical protein [Methanoculleus chikugoensis]|uniref:hypothetical protein n=1 Tax=Methanoculleus chikugoensis TaxID=118126 RepID=UPI001FB3E6B1|nr:hypothetical protein [Methanoculleus chikugoensis]
MVIEGVLAFIGVILLVAMVVLMCTALFNWLEASGGSPPRLDVWEIRGELPPENASIIHLTEKDFEQHPALDSAIRGGDNRGGPGPGIRETHRTVSSTSERLGALR